MPRIQTIICSGVCILISSFATAQLSPPGKNATIQQVVGYQLYQQKKWNHNQLPKNSLQYWSDSKYISLNDRKNSPMKLNITPVATPEIKKSFSLPGSSLYSISRSYLQNSRFLKYMWSDQKQKLGLSL